MQDTDTRSQAQPSVIIVTGGRDFCPSRAWDDAIRRLLHEHKAIAMFEGEARGLDLWAAAIGRRMNIPVHTVPALWEHQGKRAGPVRNGRMLQWAIFLGSELRAPVKLFAFPGGRGTANMTEKAEARTGVEVIKVRL